MKTFCFGHRANNVLCRLARLQHEAIRHRRRVRVAVLVEPGKRCLADLGVRGLALRHQAWFFQACRSRRIGSDRHGIHPSVSVDPLQQVGPRDGESATQPSHAIQLGKRAQDNHVLASLDQVNTRRRIAEVDVGLVHHHDGALRLVLHQVLDLLVAGERARRIVRRADVEQPCVGSGGQHSLNIVRPRLGQRNIDHARAHRFRGSGARFVARLGNHEARLG